MTWRWDQSAGELSRDGAFVSRGYSGRDRGLNNPAMQAVPGIGPVPQGPWRIDGPPYTGNCGPFTLRLTAVDGRADDVHGPTGRGTFRIHGDNAKLDRSASHGCIILPRAVREAIWRSGDRDLQVVA